MRLRRLLLCAGLLGVSNAAGPRPESAPSQYQAVFNAAAPSQESTSSQYENDPRLGRLTEFFDSFGSPVKQLAGDFLMAADLHNLDWRLLPSICIVESGGGKHLRRHNIFGWDSAETGFSSVREGIYTVASRIEQSKFYRGKELAAVLTTYNQRPEWGRLVKSLMRRINAAEPLTAHLPVRAPVSPVAELRSSDRLVSARSQ